MFQPGITRLQHEADPRRRVKLCAADKKRGTGGVGGASRAAGTMRAQHRATAHHSHRVNSEKVHSAVPLKVAFIWHREGLCAGSGSWDSARFHGTSLEIPHRLCIPSAAEPNPTLPHIFWSSHQLPPNLRRSKRIPTVGNLHTDWQMILAIWINPGFPSSRSTFSVHDFSS